MGPQKKITSTTGKNVSGTPGAPLEEGKARADAFIWAKVAVLSSDDGSSGQFANVE